MQNLSAGPMMLTDWREAYRVISPGEPEEITFALWERQLYTSAATTRIEFFTAPTTALAGNMPLGGQLPNYWTFLVQAIRIYPSVRTHDTGAVAAAAGQSKTALQDMFQLISEGFATFTIGDKQYGRWPLFMLPGGGGVSGGLTGATAAATTDLASFATNGNPDPRAVYTLGIPLAIPPQYNFRLTLDWPVAQTLVAGNPQVYAVLDGRMARPKQ